MSREFRFALGLALLAIVAVVVQMIYPIIPPLVGWPIIGVLGVGAIYFLATGVKDKEHIKEVDKPYSKEWGHYKTLTNLFISLKGVSRGDRGDVLDNISRELVELDDDELRAWVDIFLDAEAEAVRYGLKANNAMVRRVLDMTRKRMKKRYKR
ncbi:hypothetical protein ACFLWS_06995 [Chloroflexota bacterium]